MGFVITEACIDELDGSCVEVCPVDCIYEGARARYINPSECIDCGACEPVCPVNAIFQDADVPAPQAAHIADNAQFFIAILQGRTMPIGNPGGAANVGPLGADTPRVAGFAGR